VHVGLKIRELRQEQRLSQGELARRARVSRNTVNRIENGHEAPTAPVVARLAEALGVVPGVLFEEPMTTAPLAVAP
jgi:transcriptional regulator with XRE-family HTH domain